MDLASEFHFRPARSSQFLSMTRQPCSGPSRTSGAVFIAVPSIKPSLTLNRSDFFSCAVCGSTPFTSASPGPPCSVRRSKPTLAKPTLAKPTLAKPTLANVKVLVACKDFGFLELFWNFLKLIVQVFFVCIELSWVGSGLAKLGLAKVGHHPPFGTPFAGPPQPGWTAFFPSTTPIFAPFVSLGVFSWNFVGVSKRRAFKCTFRVLELSCEPQRPTFKDRERDREREK